MSKKLIIPPAIAKFCQETDSNLPQFPQPTISKIISPKRLKQVQWGLFLFLMGLGLMLRGLNIIFWIIGLIFLKISLNYLIKFLNDYYQILQTNNQAKQYQYQQAQNLLKRYQNRKLREFLKGKVKRGKIKGYGLNPSQKIVYQNLKVQFPHWQIQLGEEVKGMVIPISLVNPVTGSAIALFFELPEEETVEQLLEAYWIVGSQKIR